MYSDVHRDLRVACDPTDRQTTPPLATDGSCGSLLAVLELQQEQSEENRNKNVLKVSICFIWTQILSTVTIASFAPLLAGFCAEGEGTCWEGSA